MRQNYRMTLQYEGTRYNGWQKQGNTPNTLQQKLETLLSQLDGAPVEVRGSGRTDAGVHALGQTASFFLERARPAPELLEELNRRLPKDIAVTALEPAEPRFHARLNAKRKTYRYRLRQSGPPDVFSRRWTWACGETLDVAAMEAAAGKLVGERDFQAFCDLKPGKKSTVRRVESITIRQQGLDVIVDFTGDGFLYHMVRLLTGTLVEAGAHRLLPGQIPDILTSRDRRRAGPLAPALGLTLLQVDY